VSREATIRMCGLARTWNPSEQVLVHAQATRGLCGELSTRRPGPGGPVCTWGGTSVTGGARVRAAGPALCVSFHLSQYPLQLLWTSSGPPGCPTMDDEAFVADGHEHGEARRAGRPTAEILPRRSSTWGAYVSAKRFRHTEVRLNARCPSAQSFERTSGVEERRTGGIPVKRGTIDSRISCATGRLRFSPVSSGPGGWVMNLAPSARDPFPGCRASAGSS